MPDMPTPPPLPKKSCMINLMFPIENDTEALKVKQIINEAVKDMTEKRFTFQIIER